jgi:hypothetical protein
MQGIGRIPVTINGSKAIAVTDVDVSEPKTQVQKATADGTVIRSEGVPLPKFTLKGGLLKDKQVFLSLFDEASKQGQVDLGYRLGTEEYVLVDCGLDNIQVSSDSNGTGTFSISGVATERIRVA